MKKLFTLILMTGFACGAQAQTDGFYHVQNTYTGRYMIMTDNTKGNTSSNNIDLEAVETNRDLDYVNTHPGAVFYIKSLGGTAYDVASQGTSLSGISGNRLQAQLTSYAEGYSIWGTYSGITVVLGDRSNKDANENFNTWSVLREAGNNDKYWKLHQIDNSTHFIGIEPDVQTEDGAWWGTMYCGFAFKLHSDGMEAYYVDGVDNDHYTLKKWTGDVIPATMPVVIKCSSKSASKNVIKPVTETASEPSDNKLYGVFFDRREAGHVNHKAYDSSTMRVLGVEDGKLVFGQASTDYLYYGQWLPHNKAYLNVPSSAKKVLTVSGSPVSGINAATTDNEVKDNTIYTLSGVKLPEGVTPKPGMYIQNKKKIIIK